jgi:hypothetical protein
MSEEALSEIQENIQYMIDNTCPVSGAVDDAVCMDLANSVGIAVNRPLISAVQSAINSSVNIVVHSIHSAVTNDLKENGK